MKTLIAKYKEIKKDRPEMIMWTKTIGLTVMLCAALYAGASSFGFTPDVGSSEPSFSRTGTSRDWTGGVGSERGGQNTQVQTQSTTRTAPTESANAMMERLEAQRARTRQAIDDSQPEEVKRARARAGDNLEAFNTALDEEVNGGLRELNNRAQTINGSNPEEAMLQTRAMVEELKKSGQIPADMNIPGM